MYFDMSYALEEIANFVPVVVLMLYTKNNKLVKVVYVF